MIPGPPLRIETGSPLMYDDIDLKDFGGISRLFPLPGVVLFPHVVLPLHIFEPRYRQLTEDALAGDRFITLVQIPPGCGETGGVEPEIEAIGCLGRILECERLPDGRFNYLLLGRKRVRILGELKSSTLYQQARVELLEDIDPGPRASRYRDALVAHFRARVASLGPIDPDLEHILHCELSLGVLTDILAHALGPPLALKQQLLAERRVEERAKVLCQLLTTNAEVLSEGPRRPLYPPSISPN